jgi:hypothetical protein
MREVIQRVNTLVGEACADGEELMIVSGRFGEAGKPPSQRLSRMFRRPDIRCLGSATCPQVPLGDACIQAHSPSSAPRESSARVADDRSMV